LREHSLSWNDKVNRRSVQLMLEQNLQIALPAPS